MPKRPKEPRYYRTRRAFYVQVGGKQILLAKGDVDDPEVKKKAWEKFRELVPTKVSQIVAITDEEDECLLKHARNSLGLALIILKYSGCCPSDLCAMTAEHLDVEAKAVRIGGRVIPMGAFFRLLTNRAKHNPTGPLLRNNRGHPWTVDALHGAFVRIRDRLNLRKELTPFSYRHAYAVEYLKKGASVMALAEVLGINEKQVRKLYEPWISESPK